MRKILALVLALFLAMPACACAQTVTPQETATPSEPSALEVSVCFEDFNAYVPEGSGIRFYGKLISNEPIRRVEARCEDLRRLELLGEYVWQAEEGADDIYELQLYDMRADLFPRYRTGEFRITITVYGDTSSCVALDQRMFIAGEQAAPRNLNDECTFDCSEKREWVWSDGRLWSEWAPVSAEDMLTVTLPEGREPEGIAVNWQMIPSFARIASYDADGALIAECLIDDTSFTPLHAWYPLPAETRSFTISIPECDANIAELLVIEREKRAASVQIWQETSEKWDLMLISTHQDDEHLFFGGMLSLYASQDRETGLVYMVNCGRDRYGEALDGLWAAGITNYPVFIGLRDGIIDTKSAAYTYWGGEEPVLRALVEQIRRYTPEVIVTHDFNGEYDNNQHKVVAECTAKAVEMAADPSCFPESAELYGTWQAKKLYIHLYEENEVLFDWDQPIPGFGGYTGYDISKICYSYHRSQQKWVSYKLGLAHDPWRFGLYYTAVGPDEQHNDLFENIE